MKIASFSAISYCHLWPVGLYDISPHYLTNGTTFGKIVIKPKMCFDFLYKIRRKQFSF